MPADATIPPADASFRGGVVGFESQMRTLLFVAGRLVEPVEGAAERVELDG